MIEKAIIISISGYKLTKIEKRKLFDNYFSIFPFEVINKNSIGFDMGCGSGRWAEFIAKKVKKLNCIDPSEDAIIVAKNIPIAETKIVFSKPTKNARPYECEPSYSIIEKVISNEAS